MLASTQDARYFERMASSLGDKRHLLEWLEGGRILDVGAGGGELAEAMRATGRSVWALDGSHAAARRMREAFPKLEVLTGLAHEVGYMAPETKFTTVVCSSIFHEVYSYGTPATGPYSIPALALTLRALHESLEPGGRLIVRDGVMPAEWAKPVYVRLKASDGVRFWETYRQTAPFATWHGAQRTVHLEPVPGDPTLFAGTLESAMEFLYTYTWGWGSAKREMKELYGVFTEDGYRTFVEAHGFRVEASGEYCQPGYAEHLTPRTEILTEAGDPHPWPATNFFLVARKR